MLDLMKDIKKVKVTANPNSYSTFIYGPVKIGKSTFVKNLYGDRVLFLMTEPRERGLVGANVAHVTKWIDFVRALSQLKHHKELQKKFDVVAIDTVDNLVRFVEDYTKQHFDEKELGDKVGFGKDYKFAKDLWNKYVTSIHSLGYTPVYVGHSKDVTITVPADKASENQIEGNVEEIRKGNKVYYEFNQSQPDLPQKYMNPLNKSVDQILYLSSMLANGDEKRVIHLRNSVQWIAGSTFPNIKPTIPLDANYYRQTLKKAVDQYDKKDQTTDNYNAKPKQMNFDKLLLKAKKLGFKVAKGGHADELKRVVADIFGPDTKLLDARPTQRQQVEAAITKFEKMV